MFLSPSLILAVLIVSIYALLFHLVWGRNMAELALYWVVGGLGFGLGQALPRLSALDALVIGDVHLIEGTIGCWSLLLIAKWLKT